MNYIAIFTKIKIIFNNKAMEVIKMTEERDHLVVLVDENGEEVEFEHLDTIELDGNKYIVLLPFDQEEENEIAEVVILKIIHNEDGDDSLLTIDDEDELDTVFEEFKIRMEEDFEFSEDLEDLDN